MLTQTAYFDDCIDHALITFSFYPQKSEVLRFKKKEKEKQTNLGIPSQTANKTFAVIFSN